MFACVYTLSMLVCRAIQAHIKENSGVIHGRSFSGWKGIVTQDSMSDCTKKKVLQVTIAILIRFCRWGCGLAWVNWREVFGNKLER